MTAGKGQRGPAGSRVYRQKGITRLEGLGFRVRGREGLGLGLGLGLGSPGAPWGPPIMIGVPGAPARQGRL